MFKFLKEFKNRFIKFYKEILVCENCKEKQNLEEEKEQKVDKKDKKLTIKVKKVNNDVSDLEKFEIGDWIDLCAYDIYKAYYPDGREYDYKKTLKGKKVNEFKLISGFTYLISTGICVEVPKGYESYISPRGSTFRKTGLIQVNSTGVIDESYKGNNDVWFVPVLANRNITIKKGERLWQFRIQKKMPELKIKYVDNLNNCDRSGNGSTD